VTTDPAFPPAPATTAASAGGPSPSESFRGEPQHSEPVGVPPNVSEVFGNVRNSAESVGTIQGATPIAHESQRSGYRKPTHSLTVREVARLFEQAGVARTERSITNWCLPNRDGVPRLDSYFDPNERRYFITPESVRLAIEEEKAKARRAQTAPPLHQPHESAPATDGSPTHAEAPGDRADAEVRQLRQEVLDLKITNRAKDLFIEQLREERAAFAGERQSFIDKLLASNHRQGQLEAQMLQLSKGDAPNTTT